MLVPETSIQTSTNVELTTLSINVLRPRSPGGEREMRELNRRSDVGARWSERGIDNLLRRAAKRIDK